MSSGTNTNGYRRGHKDLKIPGTWGLTDTLIKGGIASLQIIPQLWVNCLQQGETSDVAKYKTNNVQID